MKTAAAAIAALMFCAAAPRAVRAAGDQVREGAGDGASDATRAAARKHFETAEEHFRAGRFAEALGHYKSGYETSALPGFLINIAHCHRLMGELRLARGTYRRFLLVNPQSPRRAEVEEIIADLGRAIAEVEKPQEDVAPAPAPKTPAGVEISADFWIWSALAASIVGSTVASMTLGSREAAAR
jgi:tetratricopeptide (TPR) repeat protein